MVIHQQVMEHAVELATGRAGTSPRRVQVELMGRIATAMQTRGQVLAEATTGSGKSLAYGVPAALRAAQAGERTVISTESLSLQAQIVEKDLPVVARAIRDITGREVTFAVLKGWANYVCADAAVTAALAVLASDPNKAVPTTRAELSALADRLAAARPGIAGDAVVSGRDGALVNAADLADAAAWGLRAVLDGTAGDRHSYPGAVAGPVWDAVSVSAADCLKDLCPLRELCLPAAAKCRAAAADVVVVNHALLGVQAAKNVAAVLSSRTLGRFDHVVVDEAHALPAVVRSQGGVIVSGRRIRLISHAIGLAVRRWRRTAFPVPGDFDDLIAVNVPASEKQGDGDDFTRGGTADVLNRVKVGDTVAGDVERDLARWRDAANRAGAVNLNAGDDPLSAGGPPLLAWLGDMHNLLTDLDRVCDTLAVTRDTIRLLRRIDRLTSAVNVISEHRAGIARWVELDRGDDILEAKATPVDVGVRLADNVWTSDLIAAHEDSRNTADEPEPPGAGQRRVSLSVTCVSATLPEDFAKDAGMAAELVRYDSPLADAYAECVLYVPKPTDDDIVALSNPYRTRPRFNTAAHAQWAEPRIVDLVEANGGSALVLAATASAGRRYARTLTAASGGRWRVLSQWDGRTTSAVAADWRADIPAVLVGTRSFMSGLDAPGPTCSLVVLDRPPRAAGNPVDDARKELLIKRAGLSEWAADRRVYVADAVVLLCQSVGRLVRSPTDRGMVAVLDPRLLRNNPFSYPEPTRLAYRRAYEEFGRRTSDLHTALQFLRTGRPAA